MPELPEMAALAERLAELLVGAPLSGVAPIAGDLRRVSFESHEVTYCPDCQTGGRVLADRRMSRLVRSARSNRIPP